jgi:hypothetical protein
MVTTPQLSPTARAGAGHFSRAARESVAEAAPFDHLHHGEYRRRSDDRDLLSALVLAQDTGRDVHGLTAGGRFAARCLGLDPDTDRGPARELVELGWYGDAGGCRTREALRAALLGDPA